MAAATGILVEGIIGTAAAIGVAVWGIGKAINAFMNWLKNRNLNKVLQKNTRDSRKKSRKTNRTNGNISNKVVNPNEIINDLP